MKSLTLPDGACSVFTQRWPGQLAALSIAACLLLAPATARSLTVLSKSPNVAVFTGLTSAELEFENPLAGTETVLGHPVLQWRDADYSSGPPPWFDDWSVSDPMGIDGMASEIWMRQAGHRIWTSTTVASKLISIHLPGDSNDGVAAVLVDGIEVARLHMNSPAGSERALIMVYGLANATHGIEVQDLGPVTGSVADDVHVFGAAALGDCDVKWEQPPVAAQVTNVFYGWNQPSMYQLPPFAADDWVCTTTNPVTKIRWWGSFLGWRGTTLPQPAPLGFQFAYWTDVPATVGGFSHPGVVLQTNFCTTYTATWVGWDYDPRSRTYESCFLFEQTLPQKDWFYQEPGPTGTNVFWLSIAATYQPGPMGPLWGWKSRPRSPTSPAPDAAVVIHAPPFAEPGGSFVGGEPLWWPDPTVPWDLAFELVSDYDVPMAKYEQPPEVNFGIDVNDSFNPLGQPPITNLLADDFPCVQTGPLTHITIWGSWFNDLLPGANPANLRFTLSIHTNVPAGPSGYSIPGRLLWLQTFNPGSFTVNTEFFGEEGWLDPPQGYIFPGDHICWRYDFQIPAADAFVQTGTPQSPAVYWLDVQAWLTTPTAEPVRFGWKTSPLHWMDNAVWIRAIEPYQGNQWQKLVYPIGHPRQGQPLDLAFRISTSQHVSEMKWSQPPQPMVVANAFNGWNEPSMVDAAGLVTQIVADDWVCTNASPVTDIHWWGSYLGYSQPDPPILPLGFWISIWSDVPAQPGGWSHPGQVLWTYYATNFAVHFAGWDIDPRSNVVPEACFRYDLELPESNWFRQAPGTNVYWVSVAAMLPQTGWTWGWKTLPRDPLSPALDDAVRIFTPTFPQVGAVFGTGEPIEWPTGHSWDAAFTLTTRKLDAQLDFGDAPDGPYPTLLTNNGACHLIAPNIFLGATVDAEKDGQPTVNADGDDMNPTTGPDDEDGVMFIGPFLAGYNASVKVQASVAGFVSVWIDFNGDGSWLTPGDQVFNAAPIPAGSTTLTFLVPASASGGLRTYARVRYSTQPAAIALPTGQAPDGEVEDYWLHLEQLDFGDAPDPRYPTRLTNNGARHIIGPMFLGALVDAEPDGQPNATATGDDVNPAGVPDDEDGVIFHTALVPRVPNTVTVTTSIGGILQAWIDLNADGDWADTNEQVIVDRQLGPGPNAVTFFVPYLTNAPKTFARFRLSGIRGLGYDGLAPDGEVEDYEVKIQSLKWLQEPELGYEGVDVDNQWQLADDFLCTQSGPITDFHIWGSFHGDRLPQGGPTNMTVTLMLFSDVPAGPNNPYSHPGVLLWQRTFAAGTFDAALCTSTMPGEWWYNPAQPPPFFPGDTNIYQFDFSVDRTNAFTQVEGTVYWLGMKYNAIGGTAFEFGWKTSYRAWNDDACWLDTRGAAPIWRDLRYVAPHPRAGYSMDFAFALSGEAGETFDFGDAPDKPYPTLLANNGARHTVVPGMVLGALIDQEGDGQPNATATGDDLAGVPDEDGVFFNSPMIPGMAATVQITASAPGFINAWVDFNADGSWATPGDQILTSKPVSGGMTLLTFAVPASATAGTNTFARVRYSSVSNLTFTGAAPDGEVEDYHVLIEPPPESDLGDAPDSSNSQGAAYPMTAYAGINGQFPTVSALGSPPFGPLHRFPKGRAFLGTLVSGEVEADLGVDMDGVNNLDPLANRANQDGADDGVLFPLTLPHGRPTTMSLNVTATAPGPAMFLNVWFDWNRDGDWNDTLMSPAGMPVPEWAVMNQPVPLAAVGVVPVITTPFLCWHPTPQRSNLWIRVTLSETAWPGPSGYSGAGGDGPPNGYEFGETEDYLVADYLQNNETDFGDAPDQPYPTLLARNGARHGIVPGFCLGQFIDAEPNGQPNLAALGDDLNPVGGVDDEDGVVFTGALVRGRAGTIKVTLTGPSGLLDAWVDWTRNGSWAEAGEKIFNAQPLVSGLNVLTFPVPPLARVGPTYMRFRLSTVGGLPFTGYWHDGEVEDYRVIVYQPRPLPIVITNFVVTPFNGGNIAGVWWEPQPGITFELWGTMSLDNQPPTWDVIGDPVDWPLNWQSETNSPLRERYYRVVAPYTEP